MMGPEKSGFFTLETGLSPETGLWEKQDFPPSLYPSHVQATFVKLSCLFLQQKYQEQNTVYVKDETDATAKCLLFCPLFPLFSAKLTHDKSQKVLFCCQDFPWITLKMGNEDSRK